MGDMRLLTDREVEIITALIDAADPQWAHLKHNLSGSKVTEMDEGGMGSLQFQYDDSLDRVFGENISEAEFIDQDGVTVSIALLLDYHGRLFELDSFKGDFSRLIALPDVGELKFIRKSNQ